jgi:hypothetical protein
VGGSASPQAVDQADALRAAWAQGADLAAADLLVDLEVGLGADWTQKADLAVDGPLMSLEVGLGEARAAQARPSWEGRGWPWPQRTACDVSAFQPAAGKVRGQHEDATVRERRREKQRDMDTYQEHGPGEILYVGGRVCPA